MKKVGKFVGFSKLWSEDDARALAEPEDQDPKTLAEPSDAEKRREISRVKQCKMVEFWWISGGLIIVVYSGNNPF